MYYLFRYHHWNPKDYVEMGYGARTVIAAFVAQESSEKQKEYEEVMNSGK